MVGLHFLTGQSVFITRLFHGVTVDSVSALFRALCKYIVNFFPGWLIRDLNVNKLLHGNITATAKITLRGKCSHNTLRKNVWGQNNPRRISGVFITGFWLAPWGHQRNPLVLRWFIYCALPFSGDDDGLTLTARQENLYTNLPVFFPDLQTHRGTDQRSWG